MGAATLIDLDVWQVNRPHDRAGSSLPTPSRLTSVGSMETRANKRKPGCARPSPNEGSAMTVHTFVAPTEAVGRRFINHALDESVATRRQKRVWALAAGGIGLDGYDLFIMSAAYPLVQTYFGNDSSLMAGWLAGAAVLGAVPGALISGVLADRFGRRTILQLDVVLFVLTSLLCAIAWSPLSLSS